jgi:hypothetical protein
MEIEQEEEEKKSSLKLIFGGLFIILVVGLLVMYWIVPRESVVNFVASNGEFLSCSNFEFENENMQFYENMRYINSDISYRVEGCSINKKIEMERAFYEIENKTALSFYEALEDEEIFVTCDSQTKIEGNMFIAGEGGPTNVTKVGNSHAILKSKILLIKESNCESPVIATHELFHALGFVHSENVCNIMHNFSKCSQEIGGDMIELIDNLYSYEPLADLNILSAVGELHDGYLDIDFSIKNIGLLDSKNLNVEIYSDEEFVKKFDIEEIKLGTGIDVSLKNLEVGTSPDEIKIIAEYDFEELNKSNNIYYLYFNN